MCDQTEIQYLDGDIVWVKLGACWWPGEVWEEKRLPEGTLQGLKKLPFAVVKFFEEEKFGFVKTVSDIYSYNCSRKDEFIKKGLDKFRAKKNFMEKFPNDVKKAEELTGGDLNIVNDSKYAPSPKVTYNDLYGSPVPKKKKTKETNSSKASPSKKNKTDISSPTQTTPKSNCTPGSSSYNTPTECNSDKKYNCYKCGYKTDRINVIIIHLKQHSANGLNFSPLSSRTPLNVSCNSGHHHTPNSRVSGISRTNLIQKASKSDSSGSKEQKKNASTKGKMTPGVTPKGKKRNRQSPKKKENDTASKKPKTDLEIKSKLLADWSDDQDSDVDDLDKNKSSSAPLIENKVDETQINDKNDISKNDGVKDLAPDDSEINKSRTNSVEKSEDESKPKSCFDFEEDDVIDVIPKSPGRKIPRLITKKTKKEFEYTPEPADVAVSDTQTENVIKAPSVEKDDSTKPSEVKDPDESNNIDIDIDDILNKTKLPDLPEIPQDKFANNIEVTQKPVREIMSPKERGKRIFKSKQIFKSRMQEKYGNSIKSTDENNILDEETEKDNFSFDVDITRTDDVEIAGKSITNNDTDNKTSEVIKAKKIDDIVNDNGEEEKYVDETNNEIKTDSDSIEKSSSPKATETEKSEPETNIEDEKLSKNLSLYSITNDSLNLGKIEEPKNILKKRKSRNSTSEVITKSPKIDLPLETNKNTDNFDIGDNCKIEENVGNAEVKMNLETNVLQENQKSPKLRSSEKKNVNDIEEEKPEISNNTAESLSNFSETAPKEKVKTPDKSKLNDSINSPSKLSALETTSCFGLGSIDSTEPLDVLENSAIKNKESNIEKNNKIEEKPVVVTEEKPVEVPDIQSYITSKCQTPEKNVKPLNKSRLHNILTESSGSSVAKEVHKNLLTKPSGKINDISATPKKQFFIKMKNEKKEILNKDSDKITMDQIDDIETFVIEKPKQPILSSTDVSNQSSKQMKTEMRILKKQPVRKPAIITKKSVSAKNVTQEESIFDINSMPIVLSDEIITNDNLDQMQLVLPENIEEPSMKIDNSLIILENRKQDNTANKNELKTPTPKIGQKMQIIRKADGSNAMLLQKAAISQSNTILTKNQRVYQSPTKTKILKQNPTVITQPGKPGKFIVIPSSSAQSGSKYTVGKRLQQKPIIVKSSTSNTNQLSNKDANQTNKPIVQKVVHQKVNVDSSGNTVLFITNSNGEQSKVVLTPDQKMKSSVTPQTIVTSKGAIINPKQTVSVSTASKPSQLLLTSKGQIISKSTLQTTSKLAPVAIKQKISSNTILTSKGSLVTATKIIAPSGQVVQSNNQLLMSKGKVLTPLTANQMKKNKALTTNQKIIVNKKSINQSLLTKDQTLLNQPGVEKPKIQGQRKGFVKLSPQQLAEMEKLGFVTETSHGKIITPEGIKHMQSMTQDIKIRSFPPQRKLKSNATLKKINHLTSSGDNAQPTLHKKKIIINKQPAMPPLTPIVDSKSLLSQDSVFQKNIDTLQSVIQNNDVSVEKSSNTNTNIITQTQEQALSTAIENENNATISQEPSLAALPDAQLLAVPGETFNGPLGSFYLCSVEDNGNLTPIDNQPLYLDANNQLVPASTSVQDTVLAQEVPLPEQISTTVADTPAVAPAQLDMSLDSLENQQIVINADGQQFILDQQSLLALTEQQILTTDGQQLILQGNAQQILAALAGNQDANMLEESNLSSNENVSFQHDFGNKDILATALANTNVFQNEATNPELDIYQNLQNDYKHSTVSETSTALQQPIMSPLELPTSKKADENEKIEGINFNQNIDDSLAVIGVNSTNIPTSLDLPITITNPEIAPKSTNPLNMACEMLYQTTSYSPVTSKELSSGDIFQTPEIPINHETLVQNSDISDLSMPDLNSENKEENLNKLENKEATFASESMPLLNDDNDDVLIKQGSSPVKDEENTEKIIMKSDAAENTDQTIPKLNIDENECNISAMFETKLNKSEEEIEKETIADPETVENKTLDLSLTAEDLNTNSEKSSKDFNEKTDIMTEDSATKLTEPIKNLDIDGTENSMDIECEQNKNEIVTEVSGIHLSNSEIDENRPIDTNNSEINIITEGLQFGSEPSDLLTPSTIPETIVSPRSPPCDIPQDFCESSNSCEIPIQPNLSVDNRHEENMDIEINENMHDLEEMKKENNEDMLMNNSDKPAEETNEIEMR